MTDLRIDLFSDTKTRPTAAMLAAMSAAPVGDEQAGEDPTTNGLCDKVCELLGKEAAVFLPSGTMCNQIALVLHCRPGDEIIAEETSHIINFEAGGPAALAGAMVRAIPGVRGIFGVDQVKDAIRSPMRHAPKSRLLSIEQTANMGGGSVWPVDAIKAVSDAARNAGLAVHMDGARLLNAVVEAGVAAAEFCQYVDTTWIDLSKGLGCPVGAVLAGDQDFIDQAWRWKQRLGGSLRQSGYLAAAGIYALDHHVERLADDHANAKYLAQRLGEMDGVELDADAVETNIVIFDVAGTGKSAPDLSDRLMSDGIRIGALNEHMFRAVTHLDVDADGVREAADALAAILQS